MVLMVTLVRDLDTYAVVVVTGSESTSEEQEASL